MTKAHRPVQNEEQDLHDPTCVVGHKLLISVYILILCMHLFTCVHTANLSRRVEKSNRKNNPYFRSMYNNSKALR